MKGLTIEKNLTIRATIFAVAMLLWYVLGLLVSGLEYNPATWGWFGRAVWAIFAVVSSVIAAVIPIEEWFKLLGLPLPEADEPPIPEAPPRRGRSSW